MGRPARVTREQVLIEARVGVSPAALLRHAPSKKALFALAMESEPAGQALPTDFLASVQLSEDPARVLRRLAREFIPFIEQKMGENIARFLRARTEEEFRTIRLPFDPRKKSSPPIRAVRALEAYFRRARASGKISLRQPRAGALAFLGSLQSYVFFHRVLRIAPPVPLDTYLDTVMDLWRRGALHSGRTK